MLHVVTTEAYYPPVVTTWKILTTGASQLTAGPLCTGTGLLETVGVGSPLACIELYCTGLLETLGLP